MLAAILLAPRPTWAQEHASPKRVLVLYWYDKGFTGHVRWDESFQNALRSAPEGSIEYYPEYLEANRFPGETQSQILRDYLRQKYADRPIHVVVAQSDTSLDFLLKNRHELFPHTPIVFYSGSRPAPEKLAVKPEVTGIVVFSSYRKTLDLALSLHPHTSQVFVVSGTLERDKRFELMARDELRDYERRMQINYLTDLSPNELIARTKSLPSGSIILYVWQQTYDEGGKLLESVDVLSAIGKANSAPIYGMSGPILNSGTRGMVGGYVYTMEAGANRIAEIVIRIAKGERAQDIPIEGVPTLLMFDSRELARWGINEASLPPGSLISFKEFSFWQQYRWHIIGVLTLLVLQTSLIAVLLFERRGRRRAKESLDQLNAELELRIAARTAALDNKSRELETFAYSVAHDLKAPLRGIDGYSRLLLEDHAKHLNSEGRSFLETIQTSSEEMSQLIDDLLAYSRLERREFKSDCLELKPLISTVVEQKERELADDRIDFVVTVNGGTVLADASGLTQSLRNYLDNAVKFTRNVPQPRIEVGAKETPAGCLLWVRDNGIGFDMKYHDRIFDIFQRLNAAEDFPGTGVGLAIVRKAMERMDGRAWAESDPGHGATFYLEIPKMEQASSTNHE
jgi:signal transduction histidine kinase